MADETPVEVPKPARKGWPKGKKRGPRKPPVAAEQPRPLRILPADEEKPPVLVIVDGEEIRCNSWSFEGGFLRLNYWPQHRGRVGVRYLAVSTIKDLRIEQPQPVYDLTGSPQPAPVQRPVPVETHGGPVVHSAKENALARMAQGLEQANGPVKLSALPGISMGDGDAS